jgi:hypothetical protein
MKSLIDSCWKAEPSDRPKFAGLVETLKEAIDNQLEELPPVRDVGLLLQKVRRCYSTAMLLGHSFLIRWLTVLIRL